MGKADRQARYKTIGAASDLVTVEALVPPAYRNRLLEIAKSFRQEHRQRKEAVARIVAQVREACEKQPRRYAASIDIDRIVITSVNVPFPENIDAETLAKALASNTIPKGFAGHFERFLGELPLRDILRFCDRHGIKAPALARFVTKQKECLALRRPDLEDYLHGLVPDF